MKIRWLDRTLITGPYLCLCKNEEELKAVYEHAKQEYPEEGNLRFPTPGAASTLIFASEEAEISTVVALGDVGSRSIAEVSAILAHEASHVLDAFFEYIHEEHPSSEFKAYCLQAIVEKLVTDYKRKRR